MFLEYFAPITDEFPVLLTYGTSPTEAEALREVALRLAVTDTVEFDRSPDRGASGIPGHRWLLATGRGWFRQAWRRADRWVASRLPMRSRCSGLVPRRRAP